MINKDLTPKYYLGHGKVSEFLEFLGSKFGLVVEEREINLFFKDSLLPYAKEITTIRKLKTYLDANKNIHSEAIKTRIESYLQVMKSYLDNERRKGDFSGAKGDRFEKELTRNVYIMYDLIVYSEQTRKSIDFWSDEQILHFNAMIDILVEWYTCFLSYTGKSDDVKLLYNNVLNIAQRGHTHIAEYLNYSLQNQGGIRRIWFDKEKLNPGNNLDENIEKACHKTIFLIQLIDLVSFNQEGENWQHSEFKFFQAQLNSFWKDLTWLESTLKERYFMLKVTPLELEMDPFPELKDWYDHCVNGGHLYLELPHGDNVKLVENINKLVETIKKTRLKIIFEIPN